MGYRSTSRVSLLLLAFTAIMLAFPAMAFAETVAPDDTTSTSAPTIQSDQADYPPGGTVVLTGSNWQPGESVNIYVNDDEGRTWDRNVDVTADENGTIRDEFQLPDWFVATYKVTATGAQSGTAISSFTDAANVRVKLTGGPTLASFQVRVPYNNSNCSASPPPSQTSVPVTDSYTSVAQASETQWVQITAPNIAGYTFDGWGGGASGQTQTMCVQGKSSGNVNIDANYTAATITNTTLSAAPATGTYGGTTNLSATLTANSSGVSGKTVNFTLNGTSVGSATTNSSGVATLSNASLSGINAGPYATGVGASFAGDGTHAASSGSNSLTVNKKAITITPNSGQSKVYGSSDPTALTFTSSPALESGDSFSGKLGRASGESVGSYAINLGNLSAGSNYNLSLSATPVNFAIMAKSVTGSFTADNKTYDSTNAATISGRSLSGKVGTDDVSLTGGTATFADKNVGNGKTVNGTGFTLSGTAANNYTLASSNLTTTANITARALAVSATGVNKVYDGTNDATVNLTTDKVSGDTANAAYTSASFVNKSVGTAKTVSVAGISISGAAAGNYNLTNTTASTTANVTAKPITVTAVSDSKVYDGTASSNKTPQITPSGGIANGDTANFSQAFNTKSAGSGKTLIPSGSVNDGNSGNNYNVTFANNTNGVITAKDITGSFTADNKVYDGTNAATISGHSLNGVLSPGGTRDDVNLDGGTASFANENVGTDKTVTLTGATLVGADRDNYNLSSVGTTTANITSRDLTVTAKDQNITFGDNLPANDITYNGFVNNETKSVLGGTLQFSYNPANPHDVGTYDIIPGGLTSTNYAISFVKGTLTIAQANQTIDFTAPTGKTYGGNDFDPGATASSGLAVSYSSSTTGVCTIVQGKVHIISAGTCTIEASQSGNSNYKAATSVSRSFEIAKKALTVTSDSQSKTYWDSDPALTYKVTSGSLVGEDTFSGSLARDAGENVGSYAIKQNTLTAGGNYDLTYIEANLTITKADLTVNANDDSREYGDANPTFTGTLTGVKNDDNITASYGTSASASSPVGNYAIVPTLSDPGNNLANYNVTKTNGTLTVGKAALVVTADAKQKVYGEANPSFSATITGFKNGDTASVVNGSPALGTAATQSSPVGTYAITAGPGNLSATNYSFTFQDGTLTVTKRPITVTADPQSKTYGDPDPNLSYQITTGNLVGTDSFSGALTRDAGENVGTYAINKGTLTASSDYNLTFVGANLTISKKQLLVNAKDQSTVYGDSHLPASYELTGFVNGQNPTSAGITGAPVCTISDAAGTDVGVYNDVILCTTGNLSASNYSFAAGTKGDLTITKRPITVTPDTGQSKVYGQNDPTLGYHLATGSSLANGENFANVFIGGLSRLSGETVADGPYAITQGNLTANSNYNLTFDANGVTFTITKRPITVTPDTGQSKVYGQNDPTLTYTVPGGSLVGNDAITGNLSRAPGENVGSYAIILGSLSAGSNYGLSLSSPQVTFAITKKPIGGSFTADNKVYDGTIAAAVLSRSVNQADVVGNDNVGLTGGTASFDNKNVGTGKTVTLTGGTLAGTAAGNYTLTSVGTMTANITERPITVTADPQTKVYGQSDPILSYRVTSQLGLAQGDSFSGTLLRDPGETVAGSPYAITQGTLSAGSNYNLSFVGANLTITAANTTTTVVQPSQTHYSDVVTLTANVTGPGTPAGTVQFKINGSDVGAPQDLSGGSASLPYTVTQAPNSYQVTAVFNSSSTNWSNSTSAGKSLTVTNEDASAEFSGATYYSTPTAGGSVNVTLTAVITDAADGSRGDIRKATVSFVNRDAAGQPAFTNCANRPVGLVTVGDTTVGTATCNTTLTAGTTTTLANLYTVGMTVTNYYTRNDSLDNTVVTVAQSVAGSITGGGFLKNELSGGQYAGDTGQKTNFGFNVRLDKNGSPKGQINTIVRRGGRVYQIKGNAMTSLTTKVCPTGAASATCPGTATFNGKANIQDITNPLAPISIDGNASLQVTMTDSGEPGSSDTIGITLWDKNGGLWFSSRWVSPNTVKQLLGGGNLVVR